MLRGALRDCTKLLYFYSEPQLLMLISKTRNVDRHFIFQLDKNAARVPGGLARPED